MRCSAARPISSANLIISVIMPAPPQMRSCRLRLRTFRCQFPQLRLTHVFRSKSSEAVRSFAPLSLNSAAAARRCGSENNAALV